MEAAWHRRGERWLRHQAHVQGGCTESYFSRSRIFWPSYPSHMTCYTSELKISQLWCPEAMDNIQCHPKVLASLSPNNDRGRYLKISKEADEAFSRRTLKRPWHLKSVTLCVTFKDAELPIIQMYQALVAMEGFPRGQHGLRCCMSFSSFRPPTSQQTDTVILKMKKWRPRNATQPPQGRTGGADSPQPGCPEGCLW